MKFAWIMCLIAGPAMAGPFDVLNVAHALFDDLPDVQDRTDFDAQCGIGVHSNPHIGYCTTQNLIFVSAGYAGRDIAAYEMAHVLGHAIQVRHGVADVALREISRRRDEEDALRSMVTRQVECIAGVLMATADEPRFDLRTLVQEPFTDAHWGRNPLNLGPRVSIGTEARAQWFDIGYGAQDFAACTVEEMSADLIVEALR
ncbi:hypothetical protein L0664_06615 [Octadecabacter sp. G9-8]|uniref:Metalloprotease n=1 Tax=Octadecabacter dasysiphoniae TaxID=2909341 RepID=A0ABS9CWH1_9RHOB|nr:hypothetical protein [Octadecabacter dasysiphoniae]MCF2870734.1 hypothetical protein [Octadecabacter dasysiphoniae]